MTGVARERLCAEIPDGVVVFAIGMRINKLWKIWKWLPVLLEMPCMLEEQQANPDIGMLSTRPTFGLRNIGVLQLWRSAADLHAYAHASGGSHMAAWRRFNAKIGTDGDVGIWHETYVVPPGSMESIFVNMPRYGLGQVGDVSSARGSRASAAKRLQRAASLT